MAETVLVLNNPSSISILFTALREQVEEIWIERGASDKLDRGIGRALSVLGLDRTLPVRHVDTLNLFTAGRQRRGKVRRYREIASEIDGICRAAGVSELICSTTSAFRLARVPRLHVVDHGTGDYLRPPVRTLTERMKYAWLYSGPAVREFRYYAFLPLPGRVHLPLDRELLRRSLAEIAHPFAQDRASVLLLVYPPYPLTEQLRRLHEAMHDTPHDVYLKGHHFDPRENFGDDFADAYRPPPRSLPEVLDVLPVEFLVWGFDVPIRLAAIESTALWNIGAVEPNRVVPITPRQEILGASKLWRDGLSWLEGALNYSPFR